MWPAAPRRGLAAGGRACRPRAPRRIIRIMMIIIITIIIIIIVVIAIVCNNNHNNKNNSSSSSSSSSNNYNNNNKDDNHNDNGGRRGRPAWSGHRLETARRLHGSDQTPSGKHGSKVPESREA